MEEYLCVFDISLRIAALSSQKQDAESGDNDDDLRTVEKRTMIQAFGFDKMGMEPMEMDGEVAPAALDSTEDACQELSRQIKIASFKRLPGELMKAITSTKLSKSENYALLGFGVRSRNREVVDHINRYLRLGVDDPI